jgi:hypothetical protein
MIASTIATLLKEYCLSLLLSPRIQLMSQSPRSPIATPCAPGRARNNIKDGGSVDSNVTEGVPSLPPVESQDTAYEPKSKVTNCYAMRAPGHARNNIKEGGIILEVPMDNNYDYFSEEGRNWDKKIPTLVQVNKDNVKWMSACVTQGNFKT